MIRPTATEIWRSECEAIDQEMERLILSDWPRTQEENQVRKMQFMALVERRSEAARHFLGDAAPGLRFGLTKERKAHSSEEEKRTSAEGLAVLPPDHGLHAAPHVTDDDLTRRMKLLQEHPGS
jgi:hypothetical protein